MRPMDDTPIDSLLSELEAADPADAPQVADSVADALSERLEADTGEDDPASEA